MSSYFRYQHLIFSRSYFFFSPCSYFRYQHLIFSRSYFLCLPAGGCRISSNTVICSINQPALADRHISVTNFQQYGEWKNNFELNLRKMKFLERSNAISSTSPNHKHNSLLYMCMRFYVAFNHSNIVATYTRISRYFPAKLRVPLKYILKTPLYARHCNLL